MAVPQVQVGRLGRVGEQVLVQRDGGLVLAQAHGGGGGQHAMLGITRVQRQQLFDLRVRQGVLVALDQALGVVAARGVVVGRQLQRRLQQHLGVVEHVAGHADPGQ